MASAPVGNIIFPKLSDIVLESLPNLTSFIFPGYHSLQRLHHADLDTPFPVLFDERVAFPSLNFLMISGLDNVKKIWPNQIPQDSFSKLEVVNVASCGELLNIFSSCILKGLQSLQMLMVDNCSSLEAVFDVEGTNVNVDLEELNVDDGHVELLPKLKKLSLSGLPKLRHICNCGSSRNHFPSSMASAPVGNIIFPKLSDIILVFLPNLTSFVSPGYHSLQRLHHADLDTPFSVLFDERVAFPSLNSLTIWGLDNVKKIWPNQIPQDSFSKLEDVTVSSCGELLNIFPSCMLKRLQSLQKLFIYHCSSLEAVFDVEGTNVNVDYSSLGNTFVFPKITSLSLCMLPQLRSFYPGAHTSQWPLLEQLTVNDCHKLNVFAFETPEF